MTYDDEFDEDFIDIEKTLIRFKASKPCSNFKCQMTPTNGILLEHCISTKGSQLDLAKFMVILNYRLLIHKKCNIVSLEI